MIHEHLRLWLYAVEETSYERLELPQRRLACWVISYVQRGRVTVRTPEGRYTAKAGDVMVHPPKGFFSERSSGPGKHQWLLLDVKDGSGLELLRRDPLPRVLSLETPAEFERLFSVLKKRWEADASPLQAVRVMSCALELVGHLFGVPRGAAPGPLPAPADRFERVMDYMRNHLAEPIRRDDLAKQARLHPTHFDRVFRESYGLTPMRMLRELRLHLARQLLETTDDTLAVIAEASGFYDAAYLSRTFKARFQQTPSDYRERVKNTKRSYLSLLKEPLSALHNDD